MTSPPICANRRVTRPCARPPSDSLGQLNLRVWEDFRDDSGTGAQRHGPSATGRRRVDPGSHPNSRAFPRPALIDLRQRKARAAAAILGIEAGRLCFLGIRDTAAPTRGAEFEAAARRSDSSSRRSGGPSFSRRGATIPTATTVRCMRWLQHSPHVVAHAISPIRCGVGRALVHFDNLKGW